MSRVPAPLGRRQIWWLALRPKTLPVSLSPILVGSAVAVQQGAALHWGALLACCLAAGLIQIGTNLFNDVGDYLRGTDTPERLGPARATAQGWLSPQQVQRGAWLSFALALLCGSYLAWLGGWPIILIGLASLVAGWAYTGGPWPIAYRPLGELFVWVFFGLIAVTGSAYLHSGTWSPLALRAGNLVGLLAAAVITVNNYRDRDGDARNGKRTLAVLLGRPATIRLYQAELLLPSLLLPGLWPLLGPHCLWPLLTLPASLILSQRFARSPVGPVFNRYLAATAALQLAYCLLLAVAFVLAKPAA